MAEEDKSNSTDKLNSDKSEMEHQTEAQRIVLKTNLHQPHDGDFLPFSKHQG